MQYNSSTQITKRRLKMKVETGGLVFDDSDKRCTIIVRCAQKDGVASYLACISCVDASSGGIKWYYGFTD